MPIPRALLINETTPLVLTDFSDVFMSTRVDVDAQIIYAECADNTHSLRYLLTSRIMTTLPRWHFDLRFDESYAEPSGAPTNPQLPMPSDETICATRRRHADFDRYSLYQNPSAKLQFLRWKETMRAREKRRMEGMSLAAQSWAFFRCRVPFKPRYALERLPEETNAHIASMRRAIYPEFNALLKQSSDFTIVIGEELTTSHGAGYVRTFSCKITEVDGRSLAVSAPSKLCVKLYDDSFGDDVLSQSHGYNPAMRLQLFYTENELIQNEEDIYKRLRHAWGSVVPFYYGSHLVRSIYWRK